MLINGKSLLHTAIFHANDLIVDSLLKLCVSALIVSSPDQFPPLHAAIAMRDHKNSYAKNNALLNIICYILQNGVNVSRTNKQGLNALHLAVLKNDAEVVKLLLRYPTTAVNLKTSNLKKETALHIALAQPDRVSEDVIEALLEANQNINIQDAHGNTPLHLAMLKRDYFLISAVLSKLPNPKIKNNEGYSAIDLTKISVDPETKKMMEDYIQGVLISEQDKSSYYYKATHRK